MKVNNYEICDAASHYRPSSWDLFPFTIGHCLGEVSTVSRMSCVTVLRLHVNIPQKLSMGAFIVSVRSSIEPLSGLTNDIRASERLLALQDKTT